MSVPFSSGKDLQTIRVTSRPNAPKPSPPIKSSCFTAYFIGVEPCLSPLIVCPLLPSKRNRHTPSFERKKNVSTMKTERSYHPQNRFETKRRLLTLPQKNRLDRRLCCCVESHRHFGRIDCYLDAVCLRVSYSSNAPNRLPPSVLPDPMDLHCRCIGLDRLPTTTLRRYNSNDWERLHRDPPRHFS